MFATPAYAQSAAAASGSSGWSAALIGLLPWVLVFLIWFYFIILRPQQQRAKQHQDLMSSIKKNDVVVTGGGLIGKVAKVDEKELELEIATGVKVRVIKAMITEVRAHGAKPAND